MIPVLELLMNQETQRKLEKRKIAGRKREKKGKVTVEIGEEDGK